MAVMATLLVADEILMTLTAILTHYVTSTSLPVAAVTLATEMTIQTLLLAVVVLVMVAATLTVLLMVVAAAMIKTTNQMFLTVDVLAVSAVKMVYLTGTRFLWLTVEMSLEAVGEGEVEEKVKMRVVAKMPSAYKTDFQWLTNAQAVQGEAVVAAGEKTVSLV